MYEPIGTRRGAQDVHLDFHTQLLSSERSVFFFIVALRPQRPNVETIRDRDGDRTQDVHLDFHTQLLSRAGTTDAAVAGSSPV